MISKYMKLNILFGLCIVMMLIFSIESKANTSSVNANEKDCKHKNKISQDIHSSFTIPHITSFSPLTYEKFLAIRSNDDQFARIRISYHTFYNSFPQRLSLGFGRFDYSHYYNSIEIFEGHLSRMTREYDKEFTPVDIDLILNYLVHEDNRAFFFNGEEYDEEETIETERIFICRKEHMFTLTFIKPGSSTEAWAIHKCTDEPDLIMQGLIDILELHFIDEFE